MARKMQTPPCPRNPDRDLNRAVARLSALALALFTGNIFGMNMSIFFGDWPIFEMLPTLLALLFFCLFMGYMAIIWFFAHPVYRYIHQSGVERRAYVLSNISFAVPVILPWLVLSLATDLIAVLPYDNVRAALATEEGNFVFFLLFLFVLAILAPVMIQKLWGCRPLVSSPHRTCIEAVCRRAGLAYREVLHWPLFGGRMLTAGVMGLVKRFRYILVTDALLERLAPEELEAVIAHEIGHVKKHHLLFYLFFFAGFMVILFTFFDLFFGWLLTSETIFALLLKAGPYHNTVSSGFQGLFMVVTFVLYFRYVFGYFMRNFERQADIYVYALFDSALPLISTFHKIAAGSGEPPDKPNWHHFSIRERVNYLLRCEQDRTWVEKHHRKMRRSVIIYTAGILLAGIMGFSIQAGDMRQQFARDYQEMAIRSDPQTYLDIVQAEIARDPHDPSLRFLLAEIFRIAGQDRQSADAYEKAIILSPQDAPSLNNLAWLYATSPDESVRDPMRALTLALRAAELEPASYILDTLAECYYANGLFHKAVDTARQALETAGENREYYRKQLDRFRQSLPAGD